LTSQMKNGETSHGDGGIHKRRFRLWCCYL